MYFLKSICASSTTPNLGQSMVLVIEKDILEALRTLYERYIANLIFPYFSRRFLLSYVYWNTF